MLTNEVIRKLAQAGQNIKRAFNNKARTSSGSTCTDKFTSCRLDRSFRVAQACWLIRVRTLVSHVATTLRPSLSPATEHLWPVRELPLAILLCALVLLFTSAQSQQPQNKRRERRALPADERVPDDTLRIDTDLVPVEVTVTETQGKLVRRVNAKDVKLYEDGVERPIAFFNIEQQGGEERPAAVVFAVDTSGSMTPEEMERVSNVMRAFSNWLAERPSSCAVMTFGMKVKVLHSFSNEPRKLDGAFKRLLNEPNGLSTHAYDAVDDAIRLLVRHASRYRNGQLVKRVVVVITDGFPCGDTVESATVIERANAADVSVYTVTLPSSCLDLGEGASAHASGCKRTR